MMLLDTPFIQACLNQPTSHVPIWLMRQAGRYQPEYRQLRQKYSMLEVIQTPELAAEVTLRPIEQFHFDAAIIFADILTPLIGMGFHLEFLTGSGPHISNPINTPEDVDRLATPPAMESLLYTIKAVEMVSSELTPRRVPLIGFAGAPFTLASYAIEGAGSKTYAKTKTFMFQHPAAWQRLMKKLVTVQVDYLLAQAKAGASALQVFDSWVGMALGKTDFIRYVKSHVKQLISEIKAAKVPVIYFSMGTSAYLDEIIDCGADVVSVDWRMPITYASTQFHYSGPIQGNLDPYALLSPWPELEFRTQEILDAMKQYPGFIFNVGQGIVPETPVDHVKRLVDFVHECRK
jgi:uroporphyrinogen decarboxylase